MTQKNIELIRKTACIGPIDDGMVKDIELELNKISEDFAILKSMPELMKYDGDSSEGHLSHL